MIVHILLNVPQEQRADDRDAAKRKTHVVHVWVSMCIGLLPCEHDGFVRVVAGDARKRTNGG